MHSFPLHLTFASMVPRARWASYCWRLSANRSHGTRPLHSRHVPFLSRTRGTEGKRVSFKHVLVKQLKKGHRVSNPHVKIKWASECETRAAHWTRIVDLRPGAVQLFHLQDGVTHSCKIFLLERMTDRQIMVIQTVYGRCSHKNEQSEFMTSRKTTYSICC